MESTGIVQFFLALAVIIGAAQVMGSLARALGQPRVFGELLAGVVLGPTLLDMLHWSFFDEPQMLDYTIAELAELGVLFLMFTVGLEVHLSELLGVGKVAMWGGTFGAVLPVVMTVPLVMLFNYEFEAAVFAGVVLAATSVSISAQTLLELGLLRTREGIGLLATAVIDDVLAILLLSIVVATMTTEGAGSSAELVWIVGRMGLFLAGAALVAWFLLPSVFNWLHDRNRFGASIVAFALIAAMVFGWAAEMLGGVATITGAFIAGMGLSRTRAHVRDEIIEAVQTISYSFLVPIFFVNVGLHSDLTDIGARLVPLALLLLIVAAVSKVVGSGMGARLGGFTNGEAFRLGVCMISRGEVGLIIAAVGLANGLLGDRLFEPVFLVILLTTVLTPPLVRLVFRERADTGVRRVATDAT